MRLSAKPRAALVALTDRYTFTACQSIAWTCHSRHRKGSTTSDDWQLARKREGGRAGGIIPSYFENSNRIPLATGKACELKAADFPGEDRRHSRFVRQSDGSLGRSRTDAEANRRARTGVTMPVSQPTICHLALIVGWILSLICRSLIHSSVCSSIIHISRL